MSRGGPPPLRSHRFTKLEELLKPAPKASAAKKKPAGGSTRVAHGWRPEASPPAKIPDQRCRLTMGDWLKSDTKLLHWPLKASPRIERMYTPPSWLAAANWLTGIKGATFQTKLQLVPAHQFTHYHRDNGGGDTWMKLLHGKVLVACWSMADGEAYGTWRTMHDKSDGHNGRHWDKEGRRSWPVDDGVESPPPDWRIFRRMPSARLFVLTKGDVLVMPCSTYHYVYTVERKIVVAGDFLDGSCWERRKYSLERDKEVGSDEKTTDLDMIRRRRHSTGASSDSAV